MYKDGGGGAMSHVDFKNVNVACPCRLFSSMPQSNLRNAHVALSILGVWGHYKQDARVI